MEMIGDCRMCMALVPRSRDAFWLLILGVAVCGVMLTDSVLGPKQIRVLAAFAPCSTLSGVVPASPGATPDIAALTDTGDESEVSGTRAVVSAAHHHGIGSNAIAWVTQAPNVVIESEPPTIVWRAMIPLLAVNLPVKLRPPIQGRTEC